MRLPTRLALIGVGVLIATLAVVALLTYQIVRVTGRQGVDRVLNDELDTLTNEFPALLEGDDSVTGDDLRQAVQQYLALHPGSSRHLTVVRIGADAYSTRTGPESLLDLNHDGELPEGEQGALQSVGTDEGPVRVLNAPLTAGGQVVGRVILAGPLDEVQRDAAASLVRIAVAGAVGLVIGGTALTLATRRAVLPATELAVAARATGGSDLSARVPETDRRDEVGVLAHEFNRMLDRISDDAEHRRRLLSAVSHELRTPLAVARGHLEMFETLDVAPPGTATAPKPATSHLVAVLKGEFDRLGRITDDLEAIAHGHAGAQIDVGPVFAPDVLDELRQRLVGLDIIGVELGPAAPVVIEADQHRLAQAVLNLVINAVTHTPAGTPVTVDASADATHLGITVSDSGPGIDPAIRHRIFEPFVTSRADGSTAGSGLGLAVVKTLVEAQHGTIDMGTGSEGTTATIRLPLAT